jgi:hypothetical protein
MPASYKPLPPIEELRQLFEYDPEIGQLRWRARLSNRTFIGAVAGTQRPDGYFKIRIHGSFFYSHRIIWALFTGQDVGGMQIDHINGNKADSRFENLRLANTGENMRNRTAQVNSKSGIFGVFWDKSRNMWTVSVQAGGKTIYRKRFRSLDDAIAARREAELKFHGEYASHLGANINGITPER